MLGLEAVRAVFAVLVVDGAVSKLFRGFELLLLLSEELVLF